MTRKVGAYMAVALAAATAPVAGARAEQITFAVIGPHEYELPVNFKDFDAFVQYGNSNFSNQTFNANGNLTKSPNQDFTVGQTKLVRFITFDSLPNVGFAPEAIVPEINLNSGNSANQYGIADPVFGGAMWIKPNKDSTFGFQTFIQAPIGTSNFTNHYYDNISTIFYDYQARNWDLTGDAGGIFRSTQHAPGSLANDPGTSFFTNLRIGWKLNQPSIPVEPFFAIDYQYDTAQHYTASGLINVPNASGVPTPQFVANGTQSALHTEDLALGAGGVITISDKYNLTLRYSRSVYGYNEVPTNAIYFKFVSILP